MDLESIEASSGTAMENLYPALTECFVIILSGYVAGRMRLISATEAKGINTFVGTFSLPSLIFMSLAKLDLSSVNWIFLLAILIAKSVVFASVIVVTLLVGRPVNYGRAGIFAIFCTQSNDFAVGYPIVEALYKKTHPEYSAYLYLMAPISLAILNPLSFILMEIGKMKQNGTFVPLPINEAELSTISRHRQRFKMIVTVAKSIFLNPIICMTILGILGNFIFQHHVPAYLGGILDALGSAFLSSALFLLGLRMVGKVHKLKGPALVIPGILIMVKLIGLPLIIREVVSVLHAGKNETETVDLSTYGFLYGTFPSAPTVFVFANQYLIDVDLIASAMVACTFISAPLMFVSAKMITLTKSDPASYIKQLDEFTLDISIIAIIASFWVLLTFTLTKKICRIPHKITTCLIISQLCSCLGAILWNTIDEKSGWAGYVQFALFTIGVYSSRLWTMVLAVALLFLQCRSLCFVLKLQPLFVLIGWGFPVLLTSGVLIFDSSRGKIPHEKQNPNFVYGIPQAIIAVFLLVLCFIVTTGCLILHQRNKRRQLRFMDLVRDIANDNEGSPHSSNEEECNLVSSIPSGSADSGVSSIGKSPRCTGLPTINEGCCEDSPVVDIEDLFSNGNSNSRNENRQGGLDDGLCPSRFGCQGPKRELCQGVVRQYQEQIDDDLEYIEEEPESHQPQILRHIILLILLLGSMFVGLAISIWTLVMEQMSGIYIELSFLDAMLNFGQSMMIFAIFGLDTKEIVLPLLKFWRKIWFGANTLNLPAWHELSPETKHICEQFITHHLQSCKSSIASDKRWRLKIYRNVFTGNNFVDWLIEVGLARDRTEAVNYARHLIEGKVLKHINGVYHFYDRNLLYKFT